MQINFNFIKHFSYKLLDLDLSKVEIEHTLCLYSQEVIFTINLFSLLKTF